MALATAVATSDDREARAALQTPSVSINGPGVSIKVPSVTVESPAPKVELPTVELPPAPVAPAPTPAPAPVPVEPPALPVKPPALPVKPPALPVAPPSVPRDPVPLPGDRPSLPVDPPTLPGRSPAPSGSSSPGGPAQPRSDGSGQSTAGAPPGGGPQASGAPSLARSLARGEPPSLREWARLAPAQRRQLRRLAFHAPPPKQRVRKLRALIRRHSDCLGVLPYRGRRALELRAGLLGRAPASRRTIARRIGTSPAAVLRLERSSLRRLASADERGLCGGGASGAAVGGPGSDFGGPGDVFAGDGGGSDPSASESASRDPQPASKVLADVAEGGPGIDLGDGDQGPTESLLFFLLALFALLVPLAAAAIAVQRRAGNAAVAGEGGERPLLFLDVDGVVALDVFEKGLPPGEMRDSPLGFIYLPDRAGDLVRRLATRFDIVWATGWEHRANTALLRPLGLREELPALTFGKKARFGSSEWKLKRVKAYAGRRPAAWLDDNLAEPHAQWASVRSEPTLLVPVDPSAGLTPQDVDRLLHWADRVAGSPEAATANGQRRASAN